METGDGDQLTVSERRLRGTDARSRLVGCGDRVNLRGALLDHTPYELVDQMWMGPSVSAAL
jgi:hypothetical protein